MLQIGFPRNLLQDDKVLYSNQPIGVVVADTLEHATHAAELVHVKYTTELFNVVLEKGFSSAFVPEKAEGRDDPPLSSRGDLKAGLSSASARAEHVYITPTETHNPLEPHATIAVWDGDTKLTLYDATQGVFIDRQRVAITLQLHPDDVRVVSPFLGGGFGSKGPTWSHVVLTAIAANKVKRPVKLVLRREQMFGPVGFRGKTHQTLQVAAAKDGTLTALANHAVDQTSAFDEFTEPCALQAGMVYPAPNNETSHKLVRLHMGTPSFMRAPGEAPGNFSLESVMDELSYAIPMDPLALRLKNYAGWATQTSPKRRYRAALRQRPARGRLYCLPDRRCARRSSRWRSRIRSHPCTASAQGTLKSTTVFWSQRATLPGAKTWPRS